MLMISGMRVVRALSTFTIKQTIDQEFYVAKITNYPYDSFKGKQKHEFCGEKTFEYYSYFIFKEKESFYTKYSVKKGFKH